ncbi:MAG: Cas10/Cmr2 second palm domain-containing protein [Anaerolineae bacterium]
MPEFTLTVLDTPAIQSYIFESNRLRENIGASELVRRATETWPLELLKSSGRTNVAEPEATNPEDRLDTTLHIEDGDLDAEVVYIGGGNTVLLFRDKEDARKLVNRLSRRLIAFAPGLQLVAAHQQVIWEQDDLARCLDDAMRRLAQEKAAVPRSQPQLGLGVTVEGRSTGLVATTTNAAHGKPGPEATFPISEVTAGKLDAVQAANQRLHELMPGDVRRAGFEFPLDFEQFGRSEGEMSYIAVVHADGNEMGRLFHEIAQGARSARAYIDQVRTTSTHVNHVGTAALQRLLVDLVGAWDSQENQIGEVVPLYEQKLPFRPIVFGGDDITFVCDGRLGLSLAARYLELFEEESRSVGLDLYASAGIAVVKAHYPFSRAYELSQTLTASAKQLARDEADGDLSALDWHFAASGLLGDLSEIREREYTVHEGKLNLRPLTLLGTGPGSWENFTGLVETFAHDPQWKGRHNKIMALREVLRQGQNATEVFRKTLGHVLPVIDRRNAAWQETGWVGGVCGYFDAIEALDFYVPLKKEGGDANL